MGQFSSTLRERVLWAVDREEDLPWKNLDNVSFSRWPMSRHNQRVPCTAYVCMLSGSSVQWDEADFLTHETNGFLLKGRTKQKESWRACVQRIILSNTDMNITKYALVPLGSNCYQHHLSFQILKQYAIFCVVFRSRPDLGPLWKWKAPIENFHAYNLPQRTTLQLLRYVMFENPPASLTPLTAWATIDTYDLNVNETSMIQGWKTAEKIPEDAASRRGIRIYVGILFCKAPKEPFSILQKKENHWVRLPWGHARENDVSFRTAAIRLIQEIIGIQTKESDLILYRAHRNDAVPQQYFTYCVMCTGTLQQPTDNSLSWRDAKDVFDESEAQRGGKTVSTEIESLVREMGYVHRWANKTPPDDDSDDAAFE